MWTPNLLVGPVDPAFYIAQWCGTGYPTLIYHHGNNERSFDFGRFSKNTFKIIMKHNNLIVLRAPVQKWLDCRTRLSVWNNTATEKDATRCSPTSRTFTSPPTNPVNLMAWYIDRPDMINWARVHRHVRELFCDKRETYQIEPLCEAEAE